MSTSEASTDARMGRNWRPRPALVLSRGYPRERDGEPETAPVSNARLAVVVLLVAETMFFAGLIGAYLVFRFGAAVWPPPQLPRLPLAVTWLNTGVLMTSGLTMLAALRAAREEHRRPLLRALVVTALLGIVFVGVQGVEWVRLVQFGLAPSTGTFGATFYTLIGTHAVHVLGAVLWLAVVALGAYGGRFGARQYVWVETCAIYWFFVCALWLALFALVYH